MIKKFIVKLKFSETMIQRFILEKWQQEIETGWRTIE